MTSASGLEGIVVADTRLSHVDGEKGRLILLGHDVEQLAARATYEDACSLIWGGPAADGWRRRLGAARADAFERLPALGDALSAIDGMDALRASLSHLPTAPAGATVVAADHEQFAMLAGAAAVFAAAWARRSAGWAPVPPDPSLSMSADYLRMVTGADPTDAAVRALDTYLVTVCDHGMNASTFTARVVASTGSDTVSAIVAAVGALKGPLHGGAPGPVLDMLDAVGKPELAASWIDGELAAGRRIMGMGHRIYRVRDPRAAVLEHAIERLEQAGSSSMSTSGRLPLARAVEREAERILAARHPDRPLRANVEFYTAVVLDAVGLPRTLFSPTFAVGRVIGWCAHVAEQRATGRLIRPASRYTGDVPAAVA